jgi:HPt (histidine-containing phosphotransfer) domain-containing protein
VPILALTAHALRGDRERFLAAGLDGHVAKPVGARELFEALESLSTSGELSSTAPETPAAVDEDELRDLFDGDEDVLREAAGLFLEDGPRLLAGLREAVDRGDATAVREAAHTLEGAAANFGAHDVCEAVRGLGTLAREQGLAGASRSRRARAAYAAVATEVGRLSHQLTSLQESCHG